MKYTAVKQKPRVGKSDQEKVEKIVRLRETEIFRRETGRVASKKGMTERRRAH